MDSFLNATAIHNCRLIIERKQESVFCVVCTLPGIREMETQAMGSASTRGPYLPGLPERKSRGCSSSDIRSRR